jgi:phosphatidylserine/phosphatidylglycerophosphate/cardiolipin synthase-like enzyme
MPACVSAMRDYAIETTSKAEVAEMVRCFDADWEERPFVHDVGAKVRALKDLKLHGKIMIADNERAIVGSINLSPGSFDNRRELAIETTSDHVVRRLVETAHHDWKHSRKLPLSDEAVLADLQGHGVRDVSRLALAGVVQERHAW